MAEKILAFAVLVVLCSLHHGTQAVRSPERPVTPNATAIKTTEMTFTWCRVNPNKVEIDHYELYIDGALEYRGLDIRHTAKRLKPWTGYKVTLRACGFYAGSCSPYSLPEVYATQRHPENVTAVIWRGAFLVKIVALPAYAFALGVLVGVVMLSLGMLWRYFQATDWTASAPFEELLEPPVKKDLKILIGSSTASGYTASCPPMSKKTNDTDISLMTITQNDPVLLESGKAPGYTASCPPMSTKTYDMDISLTKIAQSDPVLLESGKALGIYQQTKTTGATSSFCPKDWSPAATRGQYVCIQHEELESGQLYPVVNISKEMCETQLPLHHDEQMKTDNVCDVAAVGGHCSSENGQNSWHNGQAPSELHHPCCTNGGSSKTSHTTATDLQTLSDCSRQDQQSDSETPACAEASLPAAGVESEGIVVAIDNSNIYIGAQECASAQNNWERKRNVRLKIQNLVRILERNRPKAQGFVCGSSPPATEQVWEVYRNIGKYCRQRTHRSFSRLLLLPTRRLGYTVDLEERRGKDEQRVDEGLHLSIYKALCDLSPRVLVLATGDGMKGKSEQGTSFPSCALAALEQGWTVELYSWKHCLSTEWHKLAKRYPERLNICCLDKFVNHVTFVDGKNGRKSLHVPADFPKAIRAN